jgi:AcrR family transcriptional regulator
MTVDAAPEVDGRRLRRERGRRAVVDAMIDLVLEGRSPPSADLITERSGVSQASLFRYFATLEELRRHAIERYFERFDDLIAIPRPGEGSRADRIERFVAARDTFYDRTAPMARLARQQAVAVRDFATTIDRVRASFAAQVAAQFAPELREVAPAERAQTVAVIAALTSFEAWDQLAPLGAHGRSVTLRRTIASVLDGARRVAPDT